MDSGKPSGDDNTFFAKTCELKEAFVTTRRQVKLEFIEGQRIQLADYVKDLEATLQINKSVVADLLKQKGEAGMMAAMRRLNSENGFLISQVGNLVKQRNEAQARLLIAEQLVEEYKKKELVSSREHEENVADWVDQLDRKEYVLQVYQNAIGKAVEKLRLHYGRYPEVESIFGDLDVEAAEGGRIANVIREKDELARNLELEAKKTEELRREVVRLTERCNVLTKQEQKQKKRVPFAELTNAILNSPELAECSESEKKVRLLKTELGQLYRLNNKLSAALSKMTVRRVPKRATSEDLVRNGGKISPNTRHKGSVVCDFVPQQDSPFGPQKSPETKIEVTLSTIGNDENHYIGQL